MLNCCLWKQILSSSAIFKTVPLFIVCVLFMHGCGKRLAPLPPIETVRQRADLAGVQRGSRIELNISLPVRNTSKTGVDNIDRAEVYRIVEKADAAEGVTEEEFAARSTKIASLPLTAENFQKGSVTYFDELEFSGQPVRLRYAVRFLNEAGQKAEFSDFLLLAPVARLAKAPANLAQTTTQDAIILRWDAPAANVDGSVPVSLLGYNVYRIDSASANETTKINAAPVNENQFADKFFSFGNRYKYFVRAVSLGADASPVESADSATIEVNARDIFPPAAPESLTIAAAPTAVSIFFAANTEKDIAGYRVYRSEDRSKPKAEWLNLTPELLKPNTLQDKNVSAGKTYFYYVVAVDTAGNVSAPSETVGETVP